MWPSMNSEIQYMQRHCNDLRYQISVMSGFHLLSVIKEKRQHYYRINIQDAVNNHKTIQGPFIGIPVTFNNTDKALLFLCAQHYHLQTYGISPDGNIHPKFIVNKVHVDIMSKNTRFGP